MKTFKPKSFGRTSGAFRTPEKGAASPLAKNHRQLQNAEPDFWEEQAHDTERLIRQEGDSFARRGQGLKEVSSASSASMQGSEKDTVPSGPGRPLSGEERSYFEPRLNFDLSQVRIHDDPGHEELTRDLDARAYTTGRDIVMGPGEYQSNTTEGRALLGHELTHVVQQSANPGATPSVQRAPKSKGGKGVGDKPPKDDYLVSPSKGPEDGFVLFGQDSVKLDAGDQKAIRELIAPFKGKRVTVDLHGYASVEGSDKYNENLSAHRAVAVKRYLQTLLSAETTINLFAHGETKGFGKSRKMNRRVGIDVQEVVEEKPFEISPDGEPTKVPPDFKIDFSINPFILDDLTNPDLMLEFKAPLPGPDWGVIGAQFAACGQRMTEGDRNELYRHWKSSFDTFKAANVVTDEKAAEWASAATAKVVAQFCKREHPSTMDELNDPRSPYSLPEPTIFTVDDQQIMDLYEYLRKKF